jgi:hypothetical protein
MMYRLYCQYQNMRHMLDMLCNLIEGKAARTRMPVPARA